MVRLLMLMAAALVAGQLQAEERQLKRVPFNSQDVLTINVGPIQGTMIMATSLKTLDTGVVTGECQTLIYGYNTSVEKVLGFSCYKK